jgi:hypothetical protein
MHSPRSILFLRHVSVLTAAVALATGTARAQLAHSTDSETASVSATESSSAAGPTLAVDGGEGSAALPSAPAPRGSGAGQNGGYGENGGNGHRNFLGGLTWVAGAGFNAPASDGITWGGNFTLGGGYQFDKWVSALIEYQFIDDKLPGALIAQTGATGGYAHIWSFTVDPVVNLFPGKTNNVYVTGGGGFYRKVTSFTDPVPALFCTYYFCAVGTTNAVVGHFSSNQGGWNIGGAFEHRLGGMYGESRTRLFAEARFLRVLTPAVSSSPNGLGVATVAANTDLIPVTLGVRW